jgi:hypothetical protein
MMITTKMSFGQSQITNQNAKQGPDYQQSKDNGMG